jgi:hypothetical protein
VKVKGKEGEEERRRRRRREEKKRGVIVKQESEERKKSSHFEKGVSEKRNKKKKLFQIVRSFSSLFLRASICSLPQRSEVDTKQDLVLPKKEVSWE